MVTVEGLRLFVLKKYLLTVVSIPVNQVDVEITFLGYDSVYKTLQVLLIIIWTAEKCQNLIPFFRIVLVSQRTEDYTVTLFWVPAISLSQNHPNNIWIFFQQIKMERYMFQLHDYCVTCGSHHTDWEWRPNMCLVRDTLKLEYFFS